MVAQRPYRRIKDLYEHFIAKHGRPLTLGLGISDEALRFACGNRRFVTCHFRWLALGGHS